MVLYLFLSEESQLGVGGMCHGEILIQENFDKRDKKKHR
jgi:hypothetical protein